MNFDCVITGAGLTECAFANRLDESGRYGVAVLEARGTDTNPWFHVPALYFKTMSNPKSHWRDKTGQDLGVVDRSIKRPHSRALGGSSSINGVHSLRVTDASITPLIVSGKTNAPANMTGKKASALVLEDAQ